MLMITGEREFRKSLESGERQPSDDKLTTRKNRRTVKSRVGTEFNNFHQIRLIGT